MKCTGFMRFGVIKFNTESEKNTHIFIHTHSTQSERERDGDSEWSTERERIKYDNAIGKKCVMYVKHGMNLLNEAL